MNLLRALTITVTFLCAGCGSTAQTPFQHNDRCEVEAKGQRLFVGTGDCLRQLPKRRMSGVWVLGHERSVFYEGKDSASQLPSGSYSDVWLTANPSKILAMHGLQFDGETHAYRVEFVGTLSDAPGLYGNGMWKRGALVLQMLNLEEIPVRPPPMTER
jgi:hypothetical protein